MFTLFHLIEGSSAVLGAYVGFTVGHARLEWSGAVAGGFGGLLVGRALGRLPSILAGRWLNRNLTKSDTAALRAQLEKEYYISHLIIAELLTRGERIESFRDYVQSLCVSDNPSRRHFGDRLARIWPATAPSKSAADGPDLKQAG